MARPSSQGSVVTLIVAVIALAVATGGYFAWSAGRLESPVRLSLEAPLLDGPKLPDPPIPLPR